MRDVAGSRTYPKTGASTGKGGWLYQGVGVGVGVLDGGASVGVLVISIGIVGVTDGDIVEVMEGVTFFSTTCCVTGVVKKTIGLLLVCEFAVVQATAENTNKHRGRIG